jgi:hypothetical protein
MRFSFKIAIWSFVTLGLLSCGRSEIKDPTEFTHYLADKENGLVNEKSIAGVKFKVKYLPYEYQAYLSMNGKGQMLQKEKDSVLKAFSTSVAFLLNIGPADGEDFDITKVGISSYEEFADRIEKMSFEAQDWIMLDIEGKQMKADIVRLENLNALERSRNFLVVFGSEFATENDIRTKDLCFIYDDEMFSTGKSKFVFKADDLNKTPDFKF